MDINPLNSTTKSQSGISAQQDINSSSQSDAGSFDSHLSRSIKQSLSQDETGSKENNSVNQSPENDLVMDECDCATDTELDSDAVANNQFQLSGMGENADIMNALLSEEALMSSQFADEVDGDAVQLLPQDGSELPLVETMEEVDDLLSIAENENLSDVEINVATGLIAEEQSLHQQGALKTGADIKSGSRFTQDAVLIQDAESLDQDMMAKFPAGDKPDNNEIAKLVSQIKAGKEMAESEISEFPRLKVSSLIKSSVNSLQQSQAFNASALTTLNPSSAFNDPVMYANTYSLKGNIPLTVNNPQWSQTLNDQISMMIKGGFHSAEIKLNPAHLGPLEIKMTITDDQAKIHFISHHAQVREILDQGLPRLREMFEQQGFEQVDVDVSQYSDSQNENQGEFQSEDAGSSGSEHIDQQQDSADVRNMVIEANSIVNLYA